MVFKHWCQRSRGLRQAGNSKVDSLRYIPKLNRIKLMRTVQMPRLRNYRVLAAVFVQFAMNSFAVRNNRYRKCKFTLLAFSVQEFYIV